MNQVKISDYRILAKQKLPSNIFDFIDGAAGDGITQQNNRRAFDTTHLRPFCLRDVSLINTSVNLLGFKLPSPILIAPTAFHQLVDPFGEVSTANAAKACGIPMIVSTMSNRSLEEIASESQHNQLWLQLYIFKNRRLTETLIQRAEKAGYKAIVLTVGVPISGKRERDIHNQFSLPEDIHTGNFNSNINKEIIYNYTADALDPSLTWNDVEWVKSITALPIILKGVINPQDAEEACRRNVSGIVVSNHGGRQLDTTEATLTALPDIVKIVASRTMILLDGSIERGSDILKALALGADAILIGRPVLWSLAVAGEKGVNDMLTLLREEFEMVMKLSGCANIPTIKDCCQSLLVAKQ